MTSRTPVTAQINQARRKVLGKDTLQEAALGDGLGQADPPEKGYHWARFPMGADENGNALFGPKFRVRANPDVNYLPDDGRRVFLIKKLGQWCVAGASFDDLEQAGVDTRSLNPNDRYRHFRYLDEIVNLNSYDLKDGLTVSVRELVYEVPGPPRTIKIWRGSDATTHVDLADNSFIGTGSSQSEIRPTTLDQHRYALLVFNHTQYVLNNPCLFVYPGVAISLFTELTEADLQTCYDDLPTDEMLIAIKAYYLEYGQTTIAGPSKDVDVRQFINIPSLGSSGAPDDATYIVQVADAGLPNAQDLDSLSDGLIKKTAGGVLDEAVAGTDYLSPAGVENASNKAITASTIDASDIGTTTPAAGRFNSFRLYIGGVYASFLHAFTGNRTVTIPGDANVTLVGADTTQTLTGKTIDGDDNTLQDIALSAIKTVGGNVLRFITRNGSGVISDAVNPALDNLQHNHTNTANGGQLTDAALSSAVSISKGGTGQTTQTAAFDALAPTTTQGDTIYHNGTDNVRLAKGTAGQHLRMNSGATAPEWAAGMSIDWQYFSSSGTWTKPAGCVAVEVICVGAGAGGGSGRRGAGGTTRGGGGGGSAGWVTRLWFAASQLASTETITVGFHGSGGAARTTDNTSGLAGTAGGSSYFGGNSSNNAKLIARGGDPGTGGTTSNGAGGNGAQTLNSEFQFWGSNGANGDTTAESGGYGPGGGGGGGSVATGGTNNPGGAGARAVIAAFSPTFSGGTTAGNPGAAGTTNGTSAQLFGAGGGGGGGGGTTGGAGGAPGGGGGGGGGANNGTNSGAGGDGADGGIFVISYCY
jgi:hypothetical protein